MRFSTPLRKHQFGMRGMLLFVAIVAVLMVPVAYYYRARLSRPNSFVAATLMIGKGDDAGSFEAHLDTASFRQRLLDAPQLQSLTPFTKSTDRSAWLAHHLSFRPVQNTKLVEIIAHGRSERLEADDLTTILDAAIDIIRRDAEKAKVSVTIVQTTTIHP